jgi:NAD(P)-dependent dehydrogenase (short-subunit alcohol dehydrogenase family)
MTPASEPIRAERRYMEIEGRTALVTGANRGLGRHLAEQLRDRGALVYAAARHPDSIDIAGVTPIRLDVTDEESIAAAAGIAIGVSILINNAGSSTGSSLLTGSISDIRLEMDTHYFGSLLVTRAFAGQLAAEGQSAVLNILSALSWISFPAIGAYCAAKSAAWSMTNALRQELSAQGTVVSALHVGYMDTDMTIGVNAPKSDPAVVARIALDGIGSGEYEILADEVSGSVRSGLSGGVASLYPSLKPSSSH